MGKRRAGRSFPGSLIQIPKGVQRIPEGMEIAVADEPLEPSQLLNQETMEEILDEVRYLVSQGVKEFQVIAQELTYYGIDRYKKQMLSLIHI